MKRKERRENETNGLGKGAKISLTSDRCERKYRCRCRFRWVAQLASYFVRPHVHQNASFSHSPLSHSATIIDTTPSTCFKFAKIRPFVIRSVAKISFYELDSIQAKLPPLLRPPRIHLRCRAATDGEYVYVNIWSDLKKHSLRY